jgi:hypothetical protein
VEQRTSNTSLRMRSERTTPQLFLMVTVNGANFTPKDLSAFVDTIIKVLDECDFGDDFRVAVTVFSVGVVSTVGFEEPETDHEGDVSPQDEAVPGLHTYETTISVTAGNMGDGTVEVYVCRKQGLTGVLVGRDPEQKNNPNELLKHLHETTTDKDSPCGKRPVGKQGEKKSASWERATQQAEIKAKCRRPRKTILMLMTTPKDLPDDQLAGLNNVGYHAFQDMQQIGNNVDGRHMIVGGCAAGRQWEKLVDAGAIAAGGEYKSNKNSDSSLQLFGSMADKLGHSVPVPVCMTFTSPGNGKHGLHPVGFTLSSVPGTEDQQQVTLEDDNDESKNSQIELWRLELDKFKTNLSREFSNPHTLGVYCIGCTAMSQQFLEKLHRAFVSQTLPLMFPQVDHRVAMGVACATVCGAGGELTWQCTRKDGRGPGKLVFDQMSCSGIAFVVPGPPQEPVKEARKN